MAILPLAVGVGVLVGHHGRGGSGDKALLEALRNQPAPVVKVNGGGPASAAVPATAKSKKSSSHAKAGKKDATGAKVVAKTRYGVAHQVSGFKPSAQKVASDKKLVEKINNTIGKNYLEAQKNLPDTIVVSPGSGGSTQAPQGRGD